MGLDMGDRHTHFCVLGKRGEVVEEGRISTSEEAFLKRFRSAAPLRVALETGCHSPWASRLLTGCGHEVLVANARKLRLIYKSDRKNDRADAQSLARLARLDPRLLGVVRHRGAQSQADLAILRARDALVRSRMQTACHVRGAVKAFGARLPACSTECFHNRVAAFLPRELRAALLPLLRNIAFLTSQIRDMDRRIERLAVERYPDTSRLKQVSGVGTLTALAYILTLEDPKRFRKSRQVGVFLGMTPRQDQSGETDKQLRITKAGDGELRRLMVGSAHYILGPFGPDSDLRRWGLQLAQRGGRSAKKRAVIAVARRLSVLLHRLWVTGKPYVAIGYRQKAVA